MINAGSIVAALELDTGNFYQKIEKAKTDTDGLGNKFKGYGDGLESLGKGLTLGITAPIAALGTGIVKTSMDFESGMSKVKAISGASAEDMQLLEAKAKEMGATTKFSATESAEALSYMAMAGWKTNDMLDGLPGVMNLAAASGEELGTVSDIVTDALSAFGMQAKDSGHFADVLAVASSNANTNVSMLGESFKYVAPVAGSLGYTAEDTALALGLMANAGIKASQAGTSLRSALMNLANPSKEGSELMKQLGVNMFDANGQAVPLRNVLEQLRAGFSNMTEDTAAASAEILFGKEAMAGMLSIINASDSDFNNYINHLDNAAGAAEKMAKTMEDNVKGQLTLLKSNLEGVALQLGEILLPIVNDGIKKVNDMVTAFSNLSPETQRLIVKIAGLAAAAGPLLIVGGKTAKGIGSIIDLAGKLSPAIFGATGKVAGLAVETSGAATALAGSGGLTAGLGASMAAIAPWAGAIVAGGAAVYGLYKYLSDTEIEVNLFSENVSESTAKAVGAFLDLERGATSSLEMLKASGMAVTTELSSGIMENVNAMKDQVIQAYNEQEEEALLSLQEMLNNTTEYTEQEKQTMIENARAGFDEKRKAAEDGAKRIQEILQSAANGHRTITEAEWTEINNIMQNMQQQGIEILSGTQAEHEQILQKMKEQGTQITAEMASEMIQKSAELKDQQIKDAEETYQKTVTAIKNMKTDGSKESEEMKKKMIEHAQQQRDEVVKKAEDMHSSVVAEAKKQAGDLANAISSEDGRILSNWQRLKNSIESNPIIRRIKTINETFYDKQGSHSQLNGPVKFAAGTNSAPGGLSLVGEHGPEYVYLPKGAKVFNNSESRRLPASSNITNNFTIYATSKEEIDTKKLAKELNRMQEQALRNKGVFA